PYRIIWLRTGPPLAYYEPNLPRPAAPAPPAARMAMLRILGSPMNLFGRWSRREMLRAGGLGLLGLTLPDFLRLRHTQAAQPKQHGHGFGKAKACILLYLYGGPSQLETFDPKPAAPPEIRGELKSIPSRLRGADVGELLPRTATVMDRVSVVRSVTHPYPI